MNKAKVFKIVLIVVGSLLVLLIVLLFSLPEIIKVYAKYDQSIMPPAPIWKIPPFTRDSENTPKIDWLIGEGNIYFLTWVEAHKNNNALVHYIKSFSLITVPDNVEQLMDKGALEQWKQPFPEIEKTIQLNQKALNELRLGTQMQHCEFPPKPYSLLAPSLKYITCRKLGKLIVVTGRKMEYGNKYSDALQCYINGLRFGADIDPKDGNKLDRMVSVAIINMQLKPISELVIHDKLTSKELNQIISECTRIEREQRNLADALEIEYRIWITLLYDTSQNIPFDETSNDDRILSKYFIYKGHMVRNYVNYNQELMCTMTTKTYQQFVQIDWEKIIPRDVLSRLFIQPSTKAYTQYIREICLLRLAQVDSAIRLYHQNKKQWPKSLAELKPNYLPVVPLDPFINQSFKLTEDSTGMFAYSVGPDFKDDKAKLIYGESTTNHDLGDIR
jgi:hypothetical protein